MKNFRKYFPYILVVFLFISSFIIWYLVYTKNNPNNILKVAFLDIGQGDAIYIEAPNGKQMLVDSGPGPIILSKLAKVMPFADRSIDIILATHTDADHIGGFQYVLDHYKVGKIIENGAGNTTNTFKTLEDSVVKNNLEKIIARRGMHIVLDKEHNVHFDILFPDRDISDPSKFTSNDGSIVGQLVYGDESFMLTGDATKYTEYLVVKNENSQTLHSQVLKLGHHGSKYSSSELWLEKVNPSVAIVSAGLNNKYGHPNQEVLDKLIALHIPYLETSKLGTLVFKTNGITLSDDYSIK